MGKTLLQSKTFWFNVATAVVSLGVYLQTSDLFVSNPELIGIVGVAVAVGNIVLRLVTKEPVTII